MGTRGEEGVEGWVNTRVVVNIIMPGRRGRVYETEGTLVGSGFSVGHYRFRFVFDTHRDISRLRRHLTVSTLDRSARGDVPDAVPRTVFRCGERRDRLARSDNVYSDGRAGFEIIEERTAAYENLFWSYRETLNKFEKTYRNLDLKRLNII